MTHPTPNPPAPQGCEKCQGCGINSATEPHTCPYSVEINDDDKTLCTCCDDCCHECAMDI